MELPRHRPDPTRPPTIWICGPRAYTLCTFLIKRYCNCGLTSKHHGLHYRQPPSPAPFSTPIFPLSRSHRSTFPSFLPLSTLTRSFIRVLSFVYYRVRIKLPTCNRRYPRGSPPGRARGEEGDWLCGMQSHDRGGQKDRAQCFQLVRYWKVKKRLSKLLIILCIYNIS